MNQKEVDEYSEGVPYNPNGKGKRKPICGVGINDLPHIVRFNDTDGKTRQHSGYNQWGNVLKRCYSEKVKLKHPAYVSVTVCDEWLKASNFVAWQKTQYKEDGWELDKDLLLVGNKTYSPDTCIYVPQWLNNFTIACDATRGKCLIGTHWRKDVQKYQSLCSNPITGKQKGLGYFTSELDAHLMWRKSKLEHALELKPKMDEIDLRIYPNVVTIITNAR